MKELNWNGLRGVSNLLAPKTTQEEEKVYTQEEVDLLLEQEAAKWQASQEAAVQAAHTRSRVPAGGEQQREAELARRETEIAKRELRAQAVEQLSARQLPVELADLLDYSDAERCAASLETVERIFRQAVQQGVERRIVGSAPKAGRAQARSGSLRDVISEHYNM